MIKTWKGKEETKLKKVTLALAEINLVAVDEDGRIISCLFSFCTMLATPSAKDKLVKYGYDTSFAEWDEDGRLVRLLDDFEPLK